MILPLVIAIVVPVVTPEPVPVLDKDAVAACPEVAAAAIESVPSEAFEAKLRMIAKSAQARSAEIDRALAAAGAVGDLTLELKKGAEVTLWCGDDAVLTHKATGDCRLRAVFNGGVLNWFVRRIIDWRTDEGLEVGVRRLGKAPLRVTLSQPVGFTLYKLVDWNAVELKPFTVKTSSDIEVKDIFKITFGRDAVTAEVPLPANTLKIPYAAIGGRAAAKEARLDYDGIGWTLRAGDQRDADFLPRPVMVKDNSAVAAFPKLPDPVMPDSKPIAGPIQYWTPHDWNSWVGDCAAVRWGGHVHVFYLFDRRHHRSKNGGGGHYFAHISSADLVHWDEHPDPVPPTRRWEYIGTGMPIDWKGKLHLFYGLHTDRYRHGWEKFPIGGTYAVSADGIHFTKSDVIFDDDQNPSPFIRDDGRLGIVHSFVSAKAGEYVADSIEGPWTKIHDTIPTGGDCPFVFAWRGWRYVIQGFIGMAASKSGAPGTWEDWVLSGDDIYDGLSVPVVSEYGDDRRLLIGWIHHPDGWGGWLCFRELIQHPDGRLGTKWVDEIPPPEKPLVFSAKAGEKIVKRFARLDGESPEMEFSVDPATGRAQFAEVVGGVAPRILTLSERAAAATGENDYARYLKRYANAPDACFETAIGKIRGLDRAYEVKMAVHYDPKGDTTLFDAEIAGGRTLLVIRRGKWSAK